MPNKFHNRLFGSIGIALALCLTPVAAQAESRGYVIGWLATASYYTGDVKMGCPDGRNGGVVEMHARELARAVTAPRARGARTHPGSPGSMSIISSCRCGPLPWRVASQIP